MTSLEDILQAALSAPTERREAALRLLKGELPKPEPLLTLRGLSRAIGLSVSSLRRWQIPGVDIGGRRRYRRSQVENYLESTEFRRRQAALRAERGQANRGNIG